MLGKSNVFNKNKWQPHGWTEIKIEIPGIHLMQMQQETNPEKDVKYYMQKSSSMKKNTIKLKEEKISFSKEQEQIMKKWTKKILAAVLCLMMLQMPAAEPLIAVQTVQAASTAKAAKVKNGLKKKRADNTTIM